MESAGAFWIETALSQTPGLTISSMIWMIVILGPRGWTIVLVTIFDMTIFVAIVHGVAIFRVTIFGPTIIAAVEAMIATVARSLHSRASEIARSSCRGNRRMPVIRRGEKFPVVASLTFVVDLLV
jgi:hypothetical protein